MIIRLILTTITVFFSILISTFIRKDMPLLADAFLLVIGANIYFFLWMGTGRH